MSATLYSISLSHPANAARLMLEHKGIEHRVVNVLPGVHPMLMRARGFRGGTVPALRIEGRRIQGSREIAHALEEIAAEPPLFPAEPAARRAVEEAEVWGEREFQSCPRRLFRWGMVNDRPLRTWLVGEVGGMPLPRVIAELGRPVSYTLARLEGATDTGARQVLEALPGMLDRVDRLIADGVIGGPEPNAADFQILTTVRTMLTLEDLSAYVGARASAAPARELWPDPVEPVPAFLPRDWLALLNP